MPGIAAIISKSQTPDSTLRARIDAMCSAMRHGQGHHIDIHVDERTAFGTVSLGPRFPRSHVSTPSALAVYVDGEIYCTYDEHGERHAVLERASNPATIAADLYAKYGRDFAGKLEGAFAIVVWDPARHRLTAATDRFGLRPLYFCNRTSELILCSQVGPIVEDGDGRHTLNTSSVLDLLSFGHISGNGTLISEVSTVPPATTLTYDIASDTFQQDEYWRLKFAHSPRSRSVNFYATQLASRLRDAVRCRIARGESVGILLSGGLDSRTIFACVDDLKKHWAFTYGSPGTGNVAIAQKLTAETGMGDRHEILPWNEASFLDNVSRVVAQTDGAITCFQSLANTTLGPVRSKVDVCLDGMQVIGSRIPVTPRSLSAFQLLYMHYAPMDIALLTQVVNTSHINELKEHRERFLNTVRKEFKQGNILDVLETTNIRVRQRRFITYGNAIRRNYVEIRSPLLDYSVMDLMTTVPPLFRLGNYVYLQAFKRLSPSLSRIEWEKTGLPLRASPARVAVKKAFDKYTPLRRRERRAPWHLQVIAADPAIQAFLTEALVQGRGVEERLFSREGMTQLTRRAFTDYRGADIELISRLTALELWLRTHRDRIDFV